MGRLSDRVLSFDTSYISGMMPAGMEERVLCREPASVGNWQTYACTRVPRFCFDANNLFLRVRPASGIFEACLTDVFQRET